MGFSVLVIVPYKVLPVRNAGHRGSVLYAELLSRFTKVFLLGTKDNEPSSAKAYSFEHVAFFAKNFWLRYFNFFDFFKILVLMRRHKASHLVFEQPYLLVLFLCCRFLTRATCIYHSHNIEYLRFRSYGKAVWVLLYVCEYLFNRLAHQVHSVSPDDIDFVHTRWRIKASKLHYIPAVSPLSALPIDTEFCAQIVRQRHAIESHEAILLFNGTLDYAPNTNALKVILRMLIPLLDKAAIAYKVLICGSRLPASFDQLRAYPQVVYAGFVDDIALYTKASDIMLNPVIEGGGVKVKLLDALAYNLTSVSTQSGAKGLSLEVCTDKLFIVQDGFWSAFVTTLLTLLKDPQVRNTPPSFYALYAPDAVAEKIAKAYTPIAST